MNGKAQVTQSNLPATAQKVERESVLERKIAATGEPATVLAASDSSKNENRFARLKKNLRKRSASIL